MFFPEGTRSRNGSVGTFSDGAFHLATKARVPILPIAVEGSYRCLPKNSWILGKPVTVKMRVFPPVDTADLSHNEIPQLREKIRGIIVSQVEEWRKEFSSA